jgi:hypothetical protein
MWWGEVCCNVAYQVTWSSYFGWIEWIEFCEILGIRPLLIDKYHTCLDHILNMWLS